MAAKFLRITAVIGFLTVLFFIFLLPTSSSLEKTQRYVLAQGVGQGDSVTLYGTAWSSSIGWIKFNNCDAPDINCGSSTYGVVVNDQNGHITGEAWSSSIGWIKFGNLSEFPSGSGTEGDNAAKINFSQGRSRGKVTGWARACGGTLPGDCSSMESRTDGWDGWISMSGTNHPTPVSDGTGGVTYLEEEQKIVGKAWGGPVVGWIDFSNVWFGPPDLGPFDYTLTNSTIESLVPEISPGSFASISVTRFLVSGESEEIEITTLPISPDPSPGVISVNIETNNPCTPIPECSSTLRIEVDENVPLGIYSFSVQGLSGESGLTRETIVTFKVVPEENPELEVTCEALGGPFWIYRILTWQAVIENPVGGETFEWSGNTGNSPLCETPQCDTLKTSYSTIGPKNVSVSVDGGDPIDCSTISVGVQMMFEEI